jgi:histidine ammonia-lyase
MSVSDEEWQAFRGATRAERRSDTARRMGAGTAAAYLAVRAVAEPMLDDRVLEPDIRAARRMIEDGTVVARVNAALSAPLRDVPALARASS